MKWLKYALLCAAFVIAAGSGYYWYLTRDLPTLEKIEDYQPNLVTRVWSKDGLLIAEFHLEKRVIVPFERVPKHVALAFLAAEDSHFYEHEGISYISILRAMYKNLLAGKVVQGGSTITQQVAKSFFLSSERKFSRKIREALLAHRIEKNLDKDEILHLYLNQIYFGGGAYGIQTAAQTYFDKDVWELSIAEGAMLAGLPKAPNKYSPFSSIELAKKRQSYVLGRMVESGFIDQATADYESKRALKFMPRKVDTLWIGPYFTEHVRRHIEERYGQDALYKGGLEVYTTLDTRLQAAANLAVREGLREYTRRRGYSGPKASLKTIEEIEAFKNGAKEKLKNEGLRHNETYEALVTSVNHKNMSITVDIGGEKGFVSGPELSWALLYNPTNEPDGGSNMGDIRKVLRVGDVVEVSVLDDAVLPARVAAPMRLEQASNAQAAILAIEPETGAIRAMVGGADFTKSQFNRTVQAYRQPGSAFKPIIYTSALDRGITPATIVMDTPLVFNEVDSNDKWRPKNYDERFYGPTTVRMALARSRNVVTIKILKETGVRGAIETARSLGITSPLAEDLSLALGSSAVSLQEMTVAFSTLANAGTRPEPLYIERIEDRMGNLIEHNTSTLTPAISPQTAYLATSLMQSVIQRGTGARARALGRPAAGKTGTTNALNDAWFVGYVPGLTAGAWVGYDDERQLGRGETGSVAALPIWLKFMTNALKDTPVRDFGVPEGIEFAKIDPDTGLLAGPYTKEPVFEAFKAGTAPKETSTARSSASSDFYSMESAPGGVRGADKFEELSD